MPSPQLPKPLTVKKPEIDPKTHPERQEESLVDGDRENQSDRSTRKEKADENPLYFQAIGTLQGKIERNEEGKFFIRVGPQSYPLFIPPYRYRAWLKETENFPETPLFLRVYPKCSIVPRKDPRIYFQVLVWGEENRWNEPSGVFILNGVWNLFPR